MKELEYLRDELLPKLLKAQQYIDNDLAADAMALVIASQRARIRGLGDVG